MQRHHRDRVDLNVIDFSSPSNPIGPPPVVEEVITSYMRGRLYTLYPDYEYRRLRESIANRYRLDSELVIPLNGSAEALQLLLPLAKPKTLVSIEPTFGDHKIQVAALGIPLVTIPYRVEGSKFKLDPDV